MAFVLIGCVLVALKLAGLGPMAEWSWWLVLAPFAVAAIWWAIADATGDTQRRAMARERKRVEARRERHLKAMGLETFQGKTRRKSPSADRPSP